MATYTLRADGTAGSLAAALNGDPAVAAECLSLAGYASYGAGASPGDIFQLADDGGDYRGILYALAGTSGNEFTFKNYPGDTPTLNGSDLITGWTISGTANVWKAGVTTEPKQVWIDETFGDRKDVSDETGGGAESLANEYDWFWDSDGSYFDNEANTLYLYAPGDPDTQYTSPGVEACARAYGGVASDYCIFDGLVFSKVNQIGLYAYDVSSVTARNCTFEWAWNVGCRFSADTSESGFLIEDCVARYNATVGIVGLAVGGGTIDNTILRRNKCYENGRHTYRLPVWDYEHNFTAGIKFWTSEQSNSGWKIYENEVYDNGPTGTTNNTSSFGNGIWFDAADGTLGDEVLAYLNLVYDNFGSGIFVEISSHVDVWSNIIYGCATGSDTDNKWAAAGIRVDSRENFVKGNNNIFNNSIYGCWIGIQVAEYATTGEINDCTFKNNICSGNDIELRASGGGSNDAVNGSGNVYDNNCFGAEASGFISWGGSTYNTYDAWETAHGEAWVQVEGDSLFADPDNGDLTLESGSPCKSTGDDLGPPFNIGPLPSSVWPDGVLTGNRDDY